MLDHTHTSPCLIANEHLTLTQGYLIKILGPSGHNHYDNGGEVVITVYQL